MPFPVISLLALCLGLLTSSQAWSAGQARQSPTRSEMRVYSDEGGMPRCLQKEQAFSSDETGMLLWWSDQDRFENRPKYVLLEDLARDAEWTSWGRRLGSESFAWSRGELNCENWKSLIRDSRIRDWKFLPPDSESVSGYHIDSVTLRALAQVRAGGSRYRVEEKPEETFLRLGLADREYTLALNRELTRDYGIRYSVELYRLWVLSQPGNQRFKEAALESLQSSDQAIRMGERYFGVRILFARELAHAREELGGRFGPIVETLRSFGIAADPLQLEPLGSVRKNADRIFAQVSQVLDRGEDVILVGASKGSTDVLRALIQSPEIAQHKGQKPGRGRVLAFVNLVGVVGGSIIADATDRPGMSWLLDAIAYLGSQFAARIPHDARAISDLTSRGCSSLFRQAPGRLPNELLIVNVVAATPGNGISLTPQLAKLQNLAVRRLRRHYGAGDGYVEYPLNVVPKNWAPGAKNFTLLVDSSHMLLDGSYEGKMIDTPEGRMAFLLGLLGATAEQLGR
jgi:hypothetical protein